MRKIFLSVALISICVLASAQEEEISNLNFNSALFYATKSIQPPRNVHRYLIDKSNVIVTTDTLQLPFIDDFSTNRLRSYKWVQNHITDTVYNVFGTCLGTEGIPTYHNTFSTVQSWRYSYDTIAQRVDSFPMPSDTFTFFGPASTNCFTQVPQIFPFWDPYYTYHFGTDGKAIDSTLVTANTTTIDWAPVVYFAQGEPGTLWFDNYAYVNNTYPLNPPTIGVATLDGLNEFGLPYNNNSTNTYGYGDTLTSKPINLQGMTGADSLYLSFFYEPQGLGDYPDRADSLLVEFKEVGGIWDSVWAHPGYSSQASADSDNKTFRQVLIPIPELPLQNSYYFPTFQFRFRNKASLYGNNDQWHIDYVILDAARVQVDTNITDIAFVYPFPSILKNFTLMPADQFNNPADLRDTISLTVHNLDRDASINPPATNFVKSAAELYPSASIVASPLLQTFNASEYNFIHLDPPVEYAIPTTPVWPVDSLVIRSDVNMSPTNDTRPTNDSLYHIQSFSNIMAYDDGSAERAYGVSGLGLKKFALEFNLNYPDTLVGFQVQFSQVDDNVSNLVFNFQAWDFLRLNDFTFVDAPILSLDNQRPFYVDSVNGFATYKLDTPKIISNKVYFGWAQTDERRLQVGYDLNSTLGRPHMYYYAEPYWRASSITPAGSPMIRLIFDSIFQGEVSSGVNSIRVENPLRLFPNPSGSLVYIRSETAHTPLDLVLTDMAGQVVKRVNGATDHFTIGELENGIYILSASEVNSGKTYRSKIIKTAF